MKHVPYTRRNFLTTAGSAVAMFQIVPRHVLGGEDAPSNKLNMAFVGANGRAKANIGGCSSQNLFAFCDVDTARMGDMKKKNPSAKFYQDWRKMLEENEKSIDAVVVSTPDHTHALPTMRAIEMGKHVYCEKPLTRTVSEARAISKATRKYKVCTQMGNTGHSKEGARLTNEWIPELGEIKEVHTWSNRPIWPQDILRLPEEPVPATLDWDMWVGPSPMRPYNKGYAPFKWRGWLDFGAGAIGDMGAHIIDHPVWGMNLGAPESVTLVRVERNTPGSEKETFPRSSEIHYAFPARDGRPALTLKWWDGNWKPPHPEKLEEGRKLGQNGVIYLGSKYSMMHGSHGGAPRIFPEEEMKAFPRPEKTLKRSSGHYAEWFEAIKANDPSIAKSNFDYAGPLTETLLLGCIVQQLPVGTTLKWDSKKMKTDNDVANRLLHHEYRDGWTL